MATNSYLQIVLFDLANYKDVQIKKFAILGYESNGRRRFLLDLKIVDNILFIKGLFAKTYLMYKFK